MKKFFSVLSVIAILGITTPVLAAPDGHPRGGHGPSMRHSGHHISTGHHHRHNVRHHGHGGISIHAGHPRHSYWYGYGYRDWRYSRCNYRLSWCDFPPPPPPHYFPMGGIGLNIHF